MLGKGRAQDSFVDGRAQGGAGGGGSQGEEGGYGGYSGGGLGIIILAVLGAAIVDSVTRISALKQLLSTAIGVTATCIFLFSGDIVWVAAGVMLACALTGGYIGGHVANRVPPAVLRYAIIAIGLIVTAVFAVRIYL